MSTELNPRLAFQVRLALSQDTVEALIADASRAGLTGDEIDAARAGRSFDIQAEAAIALALKLKAGACTIAARRQAEHVGLRDGEVFAITALTAEEN